MKYPILYKSNETDFFAMGLGPIQMLKATVTQEQNGIFIFEGEILTDNPLFPLVLENYIIKTDADHLLKDQRFRIKRIVPNHDGKAQIYAEHVSYLSRELTIKPEVNITGSAQIALNQWKASIVESNPFVVSSDITTSASTKWRIDKVSNPMMALGGVEGSILDRWGGEYLFDNYHISLLKKRGKTATNILAYGRNITDFEQERNILSTYTSIAPYAIYTNDSEKEIIVTVDGFVVDSEHVNKFPNRVTKPIDFSSEFGSDKIPTKARLTTLAQQYITDNEIGVPTTSIKISFLDLSQTADYAKYAFLEQVNLCDDVRVHYPKLGVNTIAKVVRVVWNCLTESYDEIEIGQKRMSLASQIQEQNKVIQEINTQTNYAMTSADGKNTIFHGLYGQDGLGEPTAIKVGDTWFKPNGLETELYVWTGIEWKLIMSTSDTTKNAREIEATMEEVEEAKRQAKSDAEQALADAKAHADGEIERINTELSTDIGGAIDLAGQAKQDAIDKANQAYDDAVAEADRLAASRDDKITIDAGQITAGVIDVARLNAVSIVTKGLTANVIKSTHIETSTATIEKLFANDATVNSLTAKTAFIDSIKAVEIDASKITSGTINTARLNAKEIITEGLVANVIKSTHIQADTALFDKLFTSTLATDRLSAQTAWIKNGMFANASIDGAKITNATIGSAKIINLDASKITAGTIDTSLVNVIAASGNKRVQIKGDGLSAVDANGKLRLAIGVQDMAGDGQSDPSNVLFYTGNGNRSFSIGTNIADTLVIGTEAWNQYMLFRTPTQIAIESSDIRLIPRGTTYNDYFRIGTRELGGVVHPTLFVDRPNAGILGTGSYWLNTIYVTTAAVRNLVVGYGVENPQEGDLFVGKITGTAGMRSLAVYNRTWSGASNVGVTNEGVFYRSTSARKYKEDITEALEIISNAKKVLNIQPVSWLDKTDLKNTGTSLRYHGFIADEFHELGLTEVVQYGSDGEVEGLAYDRISMYHNVILRDHEQQLSTVTQQLNSVANNRLQETLLLESRLLSLQKTVEQLQQEIEQLRTA